VNRTRTPGAIDFILLPVLYYASAKLGMLTVMPEGIAILWLPNSVMLAALLRFQARRYVLFAALAIAAEIAADLPAFSPTEALLFGLTNVMEATVAYVLLVRGHFDTHFSTLRDLLKFVLAGPVTGALAAALCGAAIYSHFRGTETGFLEFLRIWWFGDALGLMIFTPLLLAVWRDGPGNASAVSVKLHVFDGLIALVALVAVGLLIASRDGKLAGVHVSPVLILPFVLFVAARLGFGAAALATMVASIVVVVMTTSGRNPFGELSARDSVIQAQEFIFVMSLMALGLSALLSQLRSKQDQLEASNQRLDELNRDLEARVDERTAELKVLNRQLEVLALTDALTGLLNRRALVDLAKKEIAHSRRQGRPLAVMMIDIDHFKSINDRYGPHAGDTVLRQAAATIGRVIRAGDTAVRYGGEELVVLAPDTEPEGALDLGERVRWALRNEAIETDHATIAISASCGVTVLSEDDQDPEEIIRRADEALYAAKLAGRDRVIAIIPDRAQSTARV
jgi:diguanylate cyclase (GGDEF)-like protein